VEKVFVVHCHRHTVSYEFILGQNLVEKTDANVSLLMEVGVRSNGAHMCGGITLGVLGLSGDFFLFLESAEHIQKLVEVNVFVGVAVVGFEELLVLIFRDVVAAHALETEFELFDADIAVLAGVVVLECFDDLLALLRGEDLLVGEGDHEIVGC
jgi:hypothetical protein